MSQPRLPIGHPLRHRNTAGLSPFDVADLLTSFRSGWSGPLGMRMEKDDEPDDDETDDDEDDDLADPDAKIKIGDKVLAVKDVQRIMAREKRQGKKSGQTQLARDLGFESVEALKAALDKAADDGDDEDDDEPKGKGGKDDDTATRQAKARAEKRAREASEREARAADRERRADLKAALSDAGVTGRDNLADAAAMLDRTVPKSYDEDDLEDEVAALLERRPEFLGKTDEDDDEDDEERPKPRRAPALPAGKPKKKAATTGVFGAGGLDRAKRRGWKVESGTKS